MLQAWNKNINVTAIEDTQQIIADHFQDSLTICRYVNFQEVRMIADVGSGGGFPGFPLKIMFDHLELVIIEVNHKKLQFLQAVVDALDLKHVHLYDLDWRTFLRQVNLPIELFLARASLQPSELLRIFKTNSPYRHARLVYWASQHWQADQKLISYVYRDEPYQVGEKKRRYIFFKGDKHLT
jgi:16S rRNA (guanine(527)-N(7))-methyltransferase RsmG